MREYATTYKYHNSELPQIDYNEFIETSAGGYNHLMNGVPSYNPVTGAMMVLFRGAPSHVGEPSKIFYKKSIDGGETWTSAAALAGFTFNASIDYRNISGGYTNTGRYVLLYEKYTTGGGHTDSYSIYSDNDGTSWSTEYDAASASNSAYDWTITGLNNNVMTLDGDYIGIPYYQRRTSDLTVTYGISLSDDNGSTWTTYRQGLTFSQSDQQLGEPTMLHIADGIILAMMRDAKSAAGHTGSFFQHISYDYGVTWTYQGKPTFDSVYPQTNSDDQLLPKLSLINVFGQRVVALYYTKRISNELKVIYAMPRDLTGVDGHLGWNTNTLQVFHNWTLGQSIDGNGSTVHPNGNYRGLYVGEDQNNSSDAHMYAIRTPNDIVDLAVKLGINKCDHSLEGRVTPDFAPYYINQIYFDSANELTYIAHGTASSSDWELLNGNIVVEVQAVSFTLTKAHNNKHLKCSGATTITLPNGLHDGFNVLVSKEGAGDVTFTAAGTMNNANSYTKITTQFGAATAVHTGSNVWSVYGVDG